VRGILYKDEEIKIPTEDNAGPLALRFWKALGDIQYGRVEHPWSVVVKK
jgi:branched-chain amino acid aminotransferase